MKKKSYVKIFHKIDFLDGLMDPLLRTKPNGRNAAASSLSIASTSHIVPTNAKSKNKQIVNCKRCSHPSDDEKNDENTPPLSE